MGLSAIAEARPEGKRYEAKSVALALAIVEFLATAEQAGVSVTQVARIVGTTKSNAFRLLQTLLERGYVSDIGEGGARRYRLGTMILRLANAATRQRPLAEQAKPVLRRLAEETGLTARFGVLERGLVVALARETGCDQVRLGPSMGSRELAHCSAIGKAVLASMPEDEALRALQETGLLRRTARTITDPDSFAAELRRVRTRGFSIDDEEDFEGVIGIGAPILDHTNTVVGAISVMGLKLDRRRTDLDALGAIVRRHAATLSRELGAEPKPRAASA